MGRVRGGVTEACTSFNCPPQPSPQGGGSRRNLLFVRLQPTAYSLSTPRTPASSGVPTAACRPQELPAHLPPGIRPPGLRPPCLQTAATASVARPPARRTPADRPPRAASS